MKRLTMKDTPWAVEILQEGRMLLNSLGVKWWLSSGTMLGIYREGKLIDHDDPDLDVGIEEPADHEEITRAFLEAGFEPYATGSHQLVFKKRQVLFDIYFYKREAENQVCFIEGLGSIIKPYSLFKSLGTIEFMGDVYPTPKPINEYLVVRYGDWWVPKKEKRPWTEETPALHKI